MTKSFDDPDPERSKLLDEFAEAHREDIDTVTQVLARITSLSPEEVTPHVRTMLSLLVMSRERPFYETATPEEWRTAYHAWVESHDVASPPLSDYAVSRDSMYDDEQV